MTFFARTGKKLLQYMRFFPLLCVLVGIACFFFFELHHYLSLEKLQENRNYLLEFTRDHSWLAPCIFTGIYVLLTALSLPGALVLSITGGFLFGLVVGTISVVIGATCGSVILFCIVRLGFNDVLSTRAGTHIKAMEKGFRANAFQYLLLLRLIPIFPFFLVNIIAAAFGIRFRSFVLATSIGILPGAFAYVSVGNGISTVFDAGVEPNLSVLIQPEVIIAIMSLTIVTLIQLFYKRYKKRSNV